MTTHYRQSQTFAAWKRDVDSVLLLRLGITSEHLPDVDYWRLFVGGCSPFNAARYATVMSVDGDGARAEERWSS